MNMQALSRRRLLKMGVGALVAGEVWPGRLWAAERETGSFRFAVVNDLHYTDAQCGVFFRKMVEAINVARPELVLLAGDITDGGTAEQMAGLREALAGLKAAVYAVPGNHDHLVQDRRPYEESFRGQTNYQFEHRGWQFLGLDTCAGTAWSNVSLSEATKRYLDEALPKLDKSRPTVVFTHFPLGEGVSMRLVDAEALLDRFKEHNLVAVYSGHYHGFTAKTTRQAVLTTNVCCSLKRDNHDGSRYEGFFVVSAREGRLEREFVKFEFGPATAPTTGPA